mmetsp:Transcript_32633/g.50774  ORF Transcript_32633/g.50774 Transcript_32633/m.50774 type:complete len:95 (+) Transcript_32633:63-347(+)
MRIYGLGLRMRVRFRVAGSDSQTLTVFLGLRLGVYGLRLKVWGGGWRVERGGFNKKILVSGVQRWGLCVQIWARGVGLRDEALRHGAGGSSIQA